MAALSELIKTINEHSKGCVDNVVDMRTVMFDSKESEAFLKGEEHTYYFKVDTLDPKAPKVIHGMRQFCKMIKVPFTFMFKSPDELRKHMTEVWLPSLKGEKAVVLFKLRKDAEKSNVIRAVLKVEFTNISNADMLEKIDAVVGDDFITQYVIGKTRDDLYLHLRMNRDQSFEAVGEKCSLGFAVTMSELGDQPLTIDTGVFLHESESYINMDFGKEEFFKKKYEKLQPADLEEIFPRMVDLLKSDATVAQVKQSIQWAKEEKRSVKDLLFNLRFVKGIPESIHESLYEDLRSQKDITLWDFAAILSSAAQSIDITKRALIEREAGILIGINTFDR